MTTPTPEQHQQAAGILQGLLTGSAGMDPDEAADLVDYALGTEESSN